MSVVSFRTVKTLRFTLTPEQAPPGSRLRLSAQVSLQLKVQLPGIQGCGAEAGLERRGPGGGGDSTPPLQLGGVDQVLAQLLLEDAALVLKPETHGTTSVRKPSAAVLEKWLVSEGFLILRWF